MKKGISFISVVRLIGLSIVIVVAIILVLTQNGSGLRVQSAEPSETRTEPPGLISEAVMTTPEGTGTANTGSSNLPTATAPDPGEPYVELDPEDWKSWPVYPAGLSEAMREVYALGMENRLNDRAFSILGDCQSEPDLFMGVYDNDPEVVAALDLNLQETVAHFRGSFDRYSPTVAGGTTEGALLWHAWNTNEEGYCEPFENPLQCELRYHQPIIAFIHVGTHWEARNEQYLREIIEILIENGTVPVVVTKADNRELDERVNSNYIRLAAEYELPVWNFWASVQDLPNQGMVLDSDMYLTDEALLVHKQGALEMLDWLYRALQD